MRDFTLFSRSRSFGGRRSHSTVIVVVLLLTLVMTGASAFQAYYAARSHRATAENVLRDYATFASWEFSQTAQRALYDVLGTQLAQLASACNDKETVPDVRQWVQRKDG
jgi:hypothetical protein